MKKPLTICVIDDDTVFHFIMRAIITPLNPDGKLLVFSDGDSAIEHILVHIEDAENIPDIIFLDINIPLHDGWLFLDWYQTVQAHVGKKITIYMISDFFNNTERERMKNIPNVSGYFFKPLKVPDLKKVLDEVSAGKM